MTKDEIYKTFLQDPLLIIRKYITAEKVNSLKISDATSIKILEVIKIAIAGNIDGETEGVISRKINQYLNK